MLSCVTMRTPTLFSLRLLFLHDNLVVLQVCAIHDSSVQTTIIDLLCCPRFLIDAAVVEVIEKIIGLSESPRQVVHLGLICLPKQLRSTQL